MVGLPACSRKSCSHCQLRPQRRMSISAAFRPPHLTLHCVPRPCPTPQAVECQRGDKSGKAWRVQRPPSMWPTPMRTSCGCRHPRHPPLPRAWASGGWRGRMSRYRARVLALRARMSNSLRTNPRSIFRSIDSGRPLASLAVNGNPIQHSACAPFPASGER